MKKSLRIQPLRSSFFNPSYRSLSRPQLALNVNPFSRERSISFNSGGSSSRTGSRGSLKTSTSPAQQPKSTSASSSSNPPTLAVVPPLHPATPLAPALPHASFGLVRLDTFFALHRPLLELPLRLSARKTVSPISRLVASSSSDEATVSLDQAMDTMDGDELIEVVDLAPDGTPLGPSYITTLAATEAADGLRTAEEEVELRDLEAEATEAALQDIEDGRPDPYEAWRIGEPELQAYAPAVSRYLASHPPFCTPAPPSPPTSSTPSRQILSSLASHLSPQSLSDLSFLRPFPTALPSSSPLPETDFATQFISPLSPADAQHLSDQFLSSAALSHAWQAQVQYATHAGEPLELARRAYAGIHGRRRGFNERRRRGEVRMWSEEGGWETIDLRKSEEGAGGSPFLPAEMVDLDWQDEQAELVASLEGVRMDSTKRKRKKKITKHKYKKRRKAQKSLRQRLGK